MSNPSSPASSKQPGTPSSVDRDVLGFGKAETTKRTLASCETWVDAYLSNKHGSHLLKANINYPHPSLAALPEEVLVEDHMIQFVTHFAMWFCSNQLPAGNRKNTSLAVSTKRTYFKALRGVLCRRYPSHIKLQSARDEWWTVALKNFNREVVRKGNQDPKVTEERVSLPLHRDITSEVTDDPSTMTVHAFGLLRKKFRGVLLAW